MRYPQTAISEVAKFVNGFPFKPSDWCSTGYKIIRIQNLSDHSKPFNRTQNEVPARYLVKRGDILVSWSATIDVFEWDDEDAYLNQHIFKVDYNPHKVDKQYFKLSLKNTVRELGKFAHGSTMKHVVKGDFDNHQIPLPPLDDQVRIATLLSKVENLISRRRKQLKQLDELLKSVFLEMFGDPVRNEKGWEKKTLLEYLKDQPNNGLYKPQSAYGSGTKIIRIDSFYDGYVQKIEKLKQVQISDSEYQRFCIKSGDILINRVNSIEYLGKIGVVPQINEHIVYESNIMRFRLDNDHISPVYLMFLWRHPYIKLQILSRAKKAVNQASINQKDVLSFVVTIPPIDLQNKFVQIVAVAEGITRHFQQSLTELENLYNALSQKAFNGELDLSRVPLERKEELIQEQVMLPVSTGEENTKTINLPDPDDASDLAKSEVRKELIEKWLDAYLVLLGSGSEFVLEDFVDAAQQKLSSLLEDDESSRLGLNGYDQIKDWVFKAIEQGKISLTRNIVSEPNEEVVYGNQIILINVNQE